MSDALLSVEDLSKSFGGLVAVDDLSFEISEGEILGVIGPNGAGKSTVFNCVMGSYTVTGGRITFRNEDITDQSTHDIVNAGLARVSQHSRPIESMTVAENIRIFTMPNSVLSFEGGATRSEIREIAARVGIDDCLDERPESLPHADTRRLEIARALATDPTLILLDEPFAGLTQEEVRELSERIRSFRDDGITIVIVDHNMKGLMALVDRVVVVHNGRLLATGTPEEISTDERVHDVYLTGTEAVE